MTIGDRIKQRRLELGLSVDDLAHMIGKNRATVYRYEKNDIENLPTTILEPLAKALRTTPGSLMGIVARQKVRPSCSGGWAACPSMSDRRKLSDSHALIV